MNDLHQILNVESEIEYFSPPSSLHSNLDVENGEMNISGWKVNIYNLFLRNVISLTLQMEVGAVGLLSTLFISQEKYFNKTHNNIYKDLLNPHRQEEAALAFIIFKCLEIKSHVT